MTTPPKSPLTFTESIQQGLETAFGSVRCNEPLCMNSPDPREPWKPHNLTPSCGVVKPYPRNSIPERYPSSQVTPPAQTASPASTPSESNPVGYVRKFRDQSLPTPGKADVTTLLLQALEEIEPQQRSPSARDSIRQAINQIRAQQEKGIAKYGRSLETWNGRDPLKDAMEETVDRWQYLVQARLERADLLAEVSALRADFMELEEKATVTERLLRKESAAWEKAFEISTMGTAPTSLPMGGPSPILDGSLTIRDLVRAAFKNSEVHGFWETQQQTLPDGTTETVRACIPEKICLMHSELSEALEGFREDHSKKTHGQTEFDYEVVKETGKPEGIVSELADCCIRIFDLCGAFDWDLDRAISEKMKFNEGRPHKHGKKI